MASCRQHLVKVREGNDETVHYFVTSEELEIFKAAQRRPVQRRHRKCAKKDGPTRRATYADLHHESKAVAELMGKLSKKGLRVDHLLRAGQAAL